MFQYMNASTTAILVRVAGITINRSTFETIRRRASYGAVLWRTLDLCAAAEHRARIRVDVPSALVLISVEFPFQQHAKTSVIGPLSTKYRTLTRSLQVLTLKYNDFDESTALGAFAVLATDLRELTFSCCGLTSVRALAGRCELLRMVNFAGSHLSSLEGLAQRMHLAEVYVSGTLITSVEPLYTCPALTKVGLSFSRQFSSIEGLGDHHWLQEVDLSSTYITSIKPLSTCPALRKVDLGGCQQLSSVEDIKDLQWLQVVDFSHTAITCVASLRSCPALTKVSLRWCRQLSSLEGLDDHRWLQEVDVSDSTIASLEPLCSCPAMRKVNLHGCEHLQTAVDLLRASKFSNFD